jgi:RNA polymerase primary sigma factor
MEQTNKMNTEEQNALIADYQAGDIAAGGKVVEALNGLSIAMARKYQTKHLEFEDALSIAKTAIVEAMRSFDPDRGACLGTFATYYMRTRLQAAVNDSMTIRMPTNNGTKRDIPKILKAYASLINPTPDEISNITGIPLKRVSLLLDTMRDTVRLDDPVGDTTISSFIPDPNESDLDRKEREEHTNTLANKALALLDGMQAKVIRLRFGIGCDPHTQPEAAKKLGMTKQAVAHHEAKAMAKMQRGVKK